VEGEVRLVDCREEGGVTVEIPQIFHAGAWGTCSAESRYDYDADRTEVMLSTQACDGPT